MSVFWGKLLSPYQGGQRPLLLDILDDGGNSLFQTIGNCLPVDMRSQKCPHQYGFENHKILIRLYILVLKEKWHMPFLQCIISQMMLISVK
jgi:hypothetical protein